MSALTEALVAAQAKAVSALEKAYVAGAFEDDRMREQLDAIGCTDVIEQGYLIEALDTLRTFGATAPAYTEKRTTEKPTGAQASYIAKLASGLDIEAPDLAGVTRAQASEIIDSMQNNTYDAAKWSLPF